MPVGRIATILALLLVMLVGAHAVQPDEILADPALEARARALSAELRCMVCQNESIDDSRADLARDLRLLVRERLKAGDSDDEIRGFLVARYGSFVLLKPPLEFSTLLLWAAPALVLVLGAGAIVLAMRRRASPVVTVGLDEAERERLESLIGKDDA
jgi:cytochrome c-type biogenesis protein CcmH